MQFDGDHLAVGDDDQFAVIVAAVFRMICANKENFVGFNLFNGKVLCLSISLLYCLFFEFNPNFLAYL